MRRDYSCEAGNSAATLLLFEQRRRGGLRGSYSRHGTLVPAYNENTDAQGMLVTNRSYFLFNISMQIILFLTSRCSV